AVESSYGGKPFISMYQGETFFDGKIGEKFPSAVNQDSIFDLASLTKLLVTFFLSAKLIEHKTITLQTTVADILDEYAINYREELGRVTVRQLLCNCSGFSNWEKLYGIVDNRSSAYMFIRSRPLQYQPGTKHVYSDPGYIVLGELIELLMGARINELFENHIAVPLSLYNLFYMPTDSSVNKDDFSFVSTGYSEQRNRPLLGEVNDENAYVMDGVSGHAGLFGTARDVLKMGQYILDVMKDREKGSIISKNTLEAMLEPYSTETTWACGFYYPDKDRNNSTAGKLMSPSSIGMTGFTGTSLWIDFDRDVVITVLCNRTISPESAKFGWERDRFSIIRPMINDKVLKELL
ncbi:MAG: beta-lactamase family protein, partial [Oligoflexia bacterium]|nr:beta-lactamase family protein [Oligoflexia bacterium]